MVKSKPKGQSSADHGDLKRIFESFLNDPADGDALDYPPAPSSDAQEYKMHLEVGDSTVFLSNTQPATLLSTLRHKLRQSNQKISIVVRRKKELQQIEQLAADHERIRARLTEVEAQKADLQRKIEALDSRSTGTGQKDTLDAQRRQIEESDSRSRALLEENQRLQEQIAALQTEIESLTARLLDAEKDLQQHAARKSGLAEELRLERELTGALKDMLHQATEPLEAARKEIDENTRLQQALQTRLEELMDHKLGLEEQLARARDDADQARRRSEALNLQLEEAAEGRILLEVEVKGLAVSLAQAETQAGSLERDKAQLERSLAQTQDEIASLRFAQQSLQAQLEKANESITRLTGEKRILEETSTHKQAILEHDLAAKASQIESLKKKLEQQASGRLPHSSHNGLEQKLASAEQSLQSLRLKHDSAQEELKQKQSRIDQANASLVQTQQKLADNEKILEELLADHNTAGDLLKHKQFEIDRINETLTDARRHLAGTEQTLESLRDEHRLVAEKLCRQEQLHQKEMAEKHQQIRSLQDELKETADCVTEFERLVHQVDAENADLRVNVEKTTERIVAIQAQTAEQAEQNERLSRQVAEMKHSVAVASETEESLRKTKALIRGLEQELSQEKDNHEGTLRQLQRQKAIDADLNSKIENQAVEINQLRQQMQEILDNRQMLKTNFSDLGPDPLKRRLMEMAGKIETLNLQLHERTNSLKQTQKQLEQVQSQVPLPPAANPPQPVDSEPVSIDESAPKAVPLSPAAAKAQDSIRKLRDELQQHRSESQQSQEKLSRAAEELETLNPGSAQPPKKSLQQRFGLFNRRS